MSMKGAVKGRCPSGKCEPVQTEVWSFVRGDQDTSLREALLAAELNLLICEQCGRAYYPEATVVYLDPEAELLAFVFPESYRGEAGKWRRKMREDYAAMKQALAEKMPLSVEPLSFFGYDEIRAVLRADDDLRDEVMIAEHLFKELDLEPYRVMRSFARIRGLPWIVPYPAGRKDGAFLRDAAMDAARKLLSANDRLNAYKGWIKFLESGEDPPPAKR